MKAAWQGYMVIGELAFPVRLFSATRTMRPNLTRLHAKDESPVRHVIKCQVEDTEVSNSELTRAVEYQPGRYLPLSEDELSQTAPSNPKSIEVRQFCEPDAVDPIYYQKPYYIVPQTGGERAYTLLREALVRSRKMAIAQFMLYAKCHIGAVRVYGGAIMLHQLRYATEMLPREEVPMPSLPQPKPTETQTALAVLDHLSGPFFIEDYRDEQTDKLNALIESKAKGLPPPRTKTAPLHTTPETELLPRLRATLGQPPRLP